ncbi:MAG TPA: A24 family peptidase [Acidimicrobiales bacterium]|nr:A24 family peptidase [Acidimicrobiales bacterium]
MNALVTGVSAAGGLVLGDGIEIFVHRLGERRPLDRPWWRCEVCEAPPTGIGRVPVVRVLSRRRGCLSCGAPVKQSFRPAVLAVVSALVLAGFAVRFGADVVLAAYAVFGLSMVAISAVDLERWIIPNRIIYPTLALLVPLFVVASAVDHRWGSLGRAAASGAAAFAGFYILHVVVPRGMGFGDVRLSGVIGLATGWLGYGHAFVAFFAAFVLGSVVGIAVIAVTGGDRKSRIPFGPFLAAGAVISIIWGNPAAHALFHRGT